MADEETSGANIGKKAVLIAAFFLLLIAVSVFAGYRVGKDVAMRDNARDAAAAAKD